MIYFDQDIVGEAPMLNFLNNKRNDAHCLIYINNVAKVKGSHYSKIKLNQDFRKKKGSCN